MTEPLLSVRDLSVSFRSGDAWKSVLRNISFEINPRETLAVVGESGSGKSVTALSVMGLHAPGSVQQSGQIQFGGRNLLDLPSREMRKIRGNEIAMIFQEPMTSLNPVMTIGDQLIEAIRLHRDLTPAEARREAIAVMDKVRIPSAATRLGDFPHNYSGGMRQRVMIAMALACEPKLLIADEPTTALDVTIQAQILDLIKTLQQEEGMGVMFITHDMGVVAEVADRTLVMFRGDAMECDTTERIFRQPGNNYTRSLLAAVPRLGSMTGRKLPAFFPTIDPDTGLAGPDTATEAPPEAKAPILEVRNLSTRFDLRKGLLGRVSARVHAVEDVSFTLAPGETLSLVGESGCGKSTTGRSIMRLVEPSAGQVLLEGTELTTLSQPQLREQRQKLQMIFQDPFASLNPRIRVGDSIAEPLIVNGLADAKAARRKAEELMVEVGLSGDMLDRFPHEFSGGQRQRICIARALTLEPKVIVADESVSALDVSVKAQVVNLLLRLQERLGLSYLFISHDMAVVERVSHRVAVMFLGEIVEIGPRDAIFANPQHPYTKRLLSAVPVADPDRRLQERKLPELEIRSPIRSTTYTRPERQWRDVSDGHKVMQWGDEWAKL
ncbi:ABC transporter ATP-binding protein, partial [Xinfangfangia sp. CPCC 101601]